jgi:hypothetical protein
MQDYRKIILQYLKRDYTNKRNKDFIISIDRLIKEKDNKLYLLEGIKIYKSLVEISIENEWIDDLIPSFNIHLKTAKNVKKSDIKNLSLNEIVKNMHTIIVPEIIMIKKIIRPEFYSDRELCRLGVKTSIIEQIFNEKLNCDFYANYVYVKKWDLLQDDKDNDEYNRYIAIEYNRNITKDVKDIHRLVFKKRYS